MASETTLSAGDGPAAKDPGGDAAFAAPVERRDAVILGAGLAGLAAAVHLARGGLTVVCVDPQPFPRQRVGESLDWSAPRLLDELGVSWRALVDDGAAVVKSGIRLEAQGEAPAEASPPPWVDRYPLRFGVHTLHVDRAEMDHRLWRSACREGVGFVWERAREVSVEGERVTAVTTASGRRLAADWFIDASGRGCRLLGRRFGLAAEPCGPAKVSLWTYFETAGHRLDGTTFHVDSLGERYLSWIWEIPIRPHTVSIGCVVDAEVVREERRAGRGVRDVLARRLARFPRLAELAREQPGWLVHSTGYVPCASRRASGENWLLAGEAAAVPDPLTSNGVTAALRHGRAAARLILAARARGRASLGPLQRRAYDVGVRSMALAYNRAIEGMVYGWPLRWGLGAEAAMRLYSMFGYLANALHSRFEPRRWPGVAVFGLLLRGVGPWVGGWSLLGKWAWRRRRRRRPPLTASGRA
jgi:flavin-dependent dehydrogenase